MTTELLNLLEDRTTANDDLLALSSLMEESGITDSLEETLFEAMEQPVEATEISAMQFHSQDNIGSVTDADLNRTFNPDNTDALNCEGKGAGVSPQSLLSYLVNESADSDEDDEAGLDADEGVDVSDADVDDDDLLGLDD